MSEQTEPLPESAVTAPDKPLKKEKVVLPSGKTTDEINKLPPRSGPNMASKQRRGAPYNANDVEPLPPYEPSEAEKRAEEEQAKKAHTNSRIRTYRKQKWVVQRIANLRSGITTPKDSEKMRAGKAIDKEPPRGWIPPINHRTVISMPEDVRRALSGEEA